VRAGLWPLNTTERFLLFLTRNWSLRSQSESPCEAVEDSPIADCTAKTSLGSKRLQLNMGGGPTSFLLRALECRDANSIPTAPTNLSD